MRVAEFLDNTVRSLESQVLVFIIHGMGCEIRQRSFALAEESNQVRGHSWAVAVRCLFIFACLPGIPGKMLKIYHL
jgi:hypothetical protein